MSARNPNDERLFRDINRILAIIILTLVIMVALPLTIAYQTLVQETRPVAVNDTSPPLADKAVRDGIDVETGLIAEDNFMLVKSTCTACHSSDLILQSAFNRETWIEKIRWMQRTQKLWDLGESEDPILDYLEKYYGPDSVMVAFRKPPLQDIQWYVLED